MAITKVQIKARTRGKGPKEFTYQGVGKVTERIVNDADGNGIVVDSKGDVVKYIAMGAKIEGKDRTKTLIEGLGVTKDKDENYILGEGLAWITVHDVDVHGVLDASKGTEALKEAVALLAEFPAKDETDTPNQRLLDAALSYYNDMARDAVAPKAEEKPDELGPLVVELLAAGLLTEKSATLWRRSVSMGATATGMTVLQFAEVTVPVKALRAKAA